MPWLWYARVALYLLLSMPGYYTALDAGYMPGLIGSLYCTSNLSHDPNPSPKPITLGLALTLTYVPVPAGSIYYTFTAALNVAACAATKPTPKQWEWRWFTFLQVTTQVAKEARKEGRNW